MAALDKYDFQGGQGMEDWKKKTGKVGISAMMIRHGWLENTINPWDYGGRA